MAESGIANELIERPRPRFVSLGDIGEMGQIPLLQSMTGKEILVGISVEEYLGGCSLDGFVRIGGGFDVTKAVKPARYWMSGRLEVLPVPLFGWYVREVGGCHRHSSVMSW